MLNMFIVRVNGAERARRYYDETLRQREIISELFYISVRVNLNLSAYQRLISADVNGVRLLLPVRL
jgi:hypothetical protein